MDQLVEIVEVSEFTCDTCGNIGNFRRFILRDVKPYKYVNFQTCNQCGITETREEDYEILDYGVSIAANLEKEDLKRIVYVNTCAETYFYEYSSANDDYSILFSFNSDRGNIDCIEELLTRGRDALNISANPDLSFLNEKIDNIINESKFKIEIVDRSGYSKIAPLSYEYTQIMNLSFEEINGMDSKIIHTKVVKEDN